MENLVNFYKGKKVLLTGHTGFKGSWLSEMLLLMGADVTGYSLEPDTTPALFDILGLEGRMKSIRGDVRDLEHMKQVFDEVQPEIVLHLAAQPIVRTSYEQPVLTYETNVMGTVNLMECLRLSDSVKSAVNVTTDKVYENKEWEYGYRETDRLDGYDPYSNSKSCSELVTHSYIQSFFKNRDIAVSTCRAGNVIGGGDFARDRIVPDCVRAAEAGKAVEIRNPNSTRPYQHVLEPLYMYLTIAMMQYKDPSYAGSYNVGPDDCDCVTTGTLARTFCDTWGEGLTYTFLSPEVLGVQPHEAGFLKLDCSKAKGTFGWKPGMHITEAITAVADWSKACRSGADMIEYTDMQINDYLSRRYEEL